MYVKRICYPVEVLGPGKRIGIWLSGCNKNCPGCMSPELKTTSNSKNLSVENIEKMLTSIPGCVDGVTISGGEPFLQAHQLYELIQFIRNNLTNDIILYSGYTLEELRNMSTADIDGILSSISVLIDGEYIDNMNDGVGIRGSSNQKVHILKNVRDYSNLSTQKRVLQTFRYNDQILIIGIQ